MRIFRAIFAIASLVLLAACAATPVPFDRAAASNLKDIGVVSPRFPEGPNVVLASNVGMSFGLIGALVEAGMQSSRDARFKAAIEKERLSVPQIFVETLKADLEQAGYRIDPIQTTRNGIEFLPKYPTDAAPKVDAYLDIVTIGYGYVAAGIQAGAPYRPYISMKVRLVSAKDGSVLMQDAIAFNPVRYAGATGAESVTIPPEPQPLYADFNALEQDSSGAVAGLRVAVVKTAQSTGKLLK
jgi:hypothetical protein